jgi:integrase
LDKVEIRRWLKHPLASFPLSAIRGHHLATHRDSRLKAGISGSTLQKEFALISHLYRVAQTDWGHETLANPVKSFRKAKIARGRERRFVGDEEQRLLAYCDEMGNIRLKTFIILAIETAMRRGELIGLKWRDVDLNARMAYLRDTKNGDRRTVPLSTRAVAAFQMMPRTSETNVVNVHPDVITYHFHLACNACGVEDLRLHDCRHESTSRLFEKGFQMVEVMTITGHKSPSMLKRYTHLKPADLLARLG